MLIGDDLVKENDEVTYINDEIKIVYIIIKIDNDKAYIKGKNYRLHRTVLLTDLVMANSSDIEKEEKENDRYYSLVSKTGRREKKRYLLGKVLHIDGDELYLKKCLELYEKMGIKADGATINEKDMPSKIGYYLDKLNPDIVVITGHDLYNQKGLKDINNYTNTKYFMETVKKIRLKKSNYECCVIAGACQSNFEAIIASGADFASSPKRINVHTFDPAIIAIKVASTSFVRVVDLDETFKIIENGRNAYGGLETLGKMRLML